MSCGCKKKQNQTSQSTKTPATPQQQSTASVQESIKKVVEKYYNKK